MAVLLFCVVDRAGPLVATSLVPGTHPLPEETVGWDAAMSIDVVGSSRSGHA